MILSSWRCAFTTCIFGSFWGLTNRNHVFVALESGAVCILQVLVDYVKHCCICYTVMITS